MKEKVMFRKYNNGEVVAVFPYIQAGKYKSIVQCYQHVGQHGQADYHYFIALTKPASEREYMPLYRELLAIGYDLQIITRARL